jgi:hypothetical protein
VKLKGETPSPTPDTQGPINTFVVSGLIERHPELAGEKV